MENYVVKFNSYTKKYGENIVLNDINFTLKEGVSCGIIGRNGSGKTLLLKAICGLITPSEGEVEVFGKTIGKDIDFPESIGLIIETPGFLPNLTGMKNLEILASLSGKIDKKKIEEAISFVGLDPNDKKTVKKYSLGMKQRLGIAQAIMEEPKLIILDEPMNSLDENGVKDVRKYILKQKEKGVSLILTSHNKDDIELLCDTVYSMDNGKISLVK